MPIQWKKLPFWVGDREFLEFMKTMVSSVCQSRIELYCIHFPFLSRFFWNISLLIIEDCDGLDSFLTIFMKSRYPTTLYKLAILISLTFFLISWNLSASFFKNKLYNVNGTSNRLLFTLILKFPQNLSISLLLSCVKMRTPFRIFNERALKLVHSLLKVHLGQGYLSQNGGGSLSSISSKNPKISIIFTFQISSKNIIFLFYLSTTFDFSIFSNPHLIFLSLNVTDYFSKNRARYFAHKQ